MASITISIPNLNISETLDAFAWKYNYDENKIDAENKAQFAKRIVARDIKRTLHEYKRNELTDVANVTANAEMNTIDIN